jgi:chromosome segregation ATPase
MTEKKELKWDKYDFSRNNNQKKTIQSLRDEIKEYENREKAFKAHLKIKDNKIKTLTKEIEDILKRDNEIINENSKLENNDYYFDPSLKIYFDNIKNLILEKEEKINILYKQSDNLQQFQNNQNFKYIQKCKELIKENNELYNYILIGTLENLKYENGLEKSQIDQLMLKLKEKEIVKKEMEYEAYQVNEEVNKKNKNI